MSRRRPVTLPPRSVPVGQMRRNLEAVQRFRLQFVFGALLVLFVGLLGRLAKLQVVDARTYSAAASSRHDAWHTFRGMTGRILDAHGRTLVTSRRVLEVAVDPQEVENAAQFARRLAILLDAEDRVPHFYEAIVTASSESRHRTLVRGIDDERLLPQLLRLSSYGATVRAGLKGLKVVEQERRDYPNGPYAAHVLGRAPLGGGGTAAGGHGVECAFRRAVEGGHVSVAVQRDGGRRRRCESALTLDAAETTGRDLAITLDIVIQHFLERALDQLVADWSPVFATGLVMDPRSGELLALANRPTFHPGHEANTYNHAVRGLYPPGSLFKPFTVSHALGSGVIGPQERIDLPMRKAFVWRRHTRSVKDSHSTAGDDGRGTVTRIIGMSSNTGVAELIWRLMASREASTTPGERSPDCIRAYLQRLGFDEPCTGLELCGGKAARYDDSQGPWNPLYPTLGFAYGQGMAVSPLRLLCSFAAFARTDARVLRPTLLPGRGGPRRDLPPVCRSPADLALVKKGLARCVDEGTARKAFAGCPYDVSGKTGTAEKCGTPFNFAGFAGFAPRERPRLLVLVMAQVDERFVHPTTEVRPYGGNVSAPAVRSVIEQSLDYLDGRLLPGPNEEGM